MNHINDTNTNRYNCSGCSACKSICPKQCISMIADDEGFLYPKVDVACCTNCGTCVKVCPWLKAKSSKHQSFPIAYAAKNTSNDIRMVSTSGGIFTALANYVLSKSGVVYGAAFNSTTQMVEHISVTSKEELQCLRGSKYVQSKLGDTYTMIRTRLHEGKYVLFTGTPCQCDGLKSYLKKDYETLYVVDILCHSTPSPRVFQDTLLSYGGGIDNVKFRDKSLGWRNSYHFELLKGEDTHNDDTYLTLFFKGLINRPSCYKCRYISTIRPSDITIGDYWNINSVNPTFEDSMGVSCILVNNDKGAKLLENINGSLKLYQTALEPALQTCMYKNVKEPASRKRFWNDYVHNGLEYCVNKYGHTTAWERFRDQKIAPIVRKIKKVIKHA